MVIGHGNDKYKYGKEILHDFSSNIPGGMDHSGLFAFLQEKLPSITDYPNPTASPLDEYIAKRLSIPQNTICISNGATEGIYLIAQAFRGCRSCVLMPTFSEYADACRMHGHSVNSIFSLNDIPNDTHLIWLCNPNNPTGTIQEKNLLIKLIKENHNKIFIIDQSYECLTEQPVLQANEILNYENVILIHSLTKEFAIPGLRLGYLTASPMLIKRIGEERMPWSVNQLAIQAGCYLLQHEQEYKLNLHYILQEKDKLTNELQELGGMEVWPSCTNFILIQLLFGKAPDLKDYLANEHQILIRDCSNFEGLNEHFFRVAVQTLEENKLLLDAIKKWMNK